LQNEESTHVEGVVPIAGALEIINELMEQNIPWTVVTSGTVPVASARMKAAGIPCPPKLVTAELITHGKPNPEPFLLGAHQLGIDIKECIVFEDAPAGVEAGLSSGAKVIGILSHNPIDKLYPIDCIHDYSQITLSNGSM
jgi:mannitol-1-/sugar-/sorbitol-6-phosphatase